MEVRFREASADDVSSIAQFHAESWRRNYRGVFSDAYLDGNILDDRNGVWAQRLVHDPDPRRLVLLAEIEDSIAGFVCNYGDHDASLGSLVDNLHVGAGFQRSGIGRALMRRGAAWLDERYPRSGVYLEVLVSNERAIHFYHALGGRLDGPMNLPAADGSIVSSYHCIWENPAALIAGCDGSA